MGLLDEADDLQLFCGRISHSPSSPSAVTLFLSRRFSRVRSATTSLSAVASRRRSWTSSEVAARAVSPARRFFPACLQEVLRPPIVKVLRDPLAATQLGNAVLAAQALQNDPDLLLGRIVLARRPSDVLNNLLSWFLRGSGLLSHLRSCERYDEPETLPYSIHPVCPLSAGGGACV